MWRGLDGEALGYSLFSKGFLLSPPPQHPGHQQFIKISAAKCPWHELLLLAVSFHWVTVTRHPGHLSDVGTA